MIAFAKDFIRRRRKEHIRLGEPATTIVVTGARRESIDAVIGPDRRLLRMIVHTRWRSSKFRYQL
jgi:hypothetical protein